VWHEHLRPGPRFLSDPGLGAQYTGKTFTNDLIVAGIVTVMLIPQSLAGAIKTQGTPEYLGATIALALLSGLLLVAMGLLRLGFFSQTFSATMFYAFPAAHWPSLRTTNSIESTF
jgi:MFS superfamily sulfate permease-like transporter